MNWTIGDLIRSEAEILDEHGAVIARVVPGNSHDWRSGRVALVAAAPATAALLAEALAALQELTEADAALLIISRHGNAKALSDAFHRCELAKHAAAAVLQRAAEAGMGGEEK